MNANTTLADLPTSGPCQYNTQCRYCCLNWQCMESEDCEEPFLDSFAFAAFIVTLVLSILILLLWCCTKKKSTISVYEDEIETLKTVNGKRRVSYLEMPPPADVEQENFFTEDAKYGKNHLIHKE